MSDLRSFLDQIKKTKDLKTIKKPVSLKYEIATITEKFEDSNALLFQNVKGRKFPVVSNLIGTRARFAQALGTKMPDIHQKMVKAISATKKPKKVKTNDFRGVRLPLSGFSFVGELLTAPAKPCARLYDDGWWNNGWHYDLEGGAPRLAGDPPFG